MNNSTEDPKSQDKTSVEKRKKNGWHKTYNVVSQSSLNVYHKAVYAYVCSRAGKDGKCTASLSTMVRELRISNHTIINSFEYMSQPNFYGHKLINSERTDSGSYSISIVNLDDCDFSGAFYQKPEKGKRKTRKILKSNDLDISTGEPRSPGDNTKVVSPVHQGGEPRSPVTGEPRSPPSELNPPLKKTIEKETLRVLSEKKGGTPPDPHHTTKPRSKSLPKCHPTEVEVSIEDTESLVALAVSLGLTREQAVPVVAKAIEDLKQWKIDNPSKATNHTDIGRLKGTYGVKKAVRDFVDTAIISQRAKRMNDTHPPSSARPPAKKQSEEKDLWKNNLF